MLDAYKIGIVINVTNNASRVLGLLSRDFVASEKAAKRLESAMKSLKLAAGLGVLAGGLAVGFEKALKPAMEYSRQLSLMNNTIRSQREQVDAIKAAWATSRSVPTSSPTENIRSVVEMRQAFGDTGAAISALPGVARLQAVLGQYNGDDAAAGAVAKALELRGATRDQGDFNRQLDAMTKGIIFTRGTLGPKEYLQFFRKAAPFTTGFSDDFLYKMAPTFMQDLGGSSAGTAVNTLEQALVGGRMTKAAKRVMESFGIIAPSSAAANSSAGGLQLLNQNNLQGSALAQSNPYEWAQKVFIPALAAKGVTDEAAIRSIIAQMFSNRNAQRVVGDFIINSFRYSKDATLTGDTMTGAQAYAQEQKNNPYIALEALQKQWNAALVQLGVVIMPDVIKWTWKLVGAAERLQKVFHDHPIRSEWALKIIAVGTALTGLAAGVSLLNAALTGSGVLALIKGGTRIASTTTIGRTAMMGGGGGMGLMTTLGMMVAGGESYLASRYIPGMNRSAANFGMWIDHMLTGSPYVKLQAPLGAAPAGALDSKTTVVNFNMDSRTVFRALFNGMGMQMDGTNKGPSIVDPRSSLIPATH